MATNRTIDMEKFKAQLKEFDALRDDDNIQECTLERIQPQLAEVWPPELDPSVHNAIKNTGIDQLYKHQVEAIRRSLSGLDIVLESPTASGKTVAFTAPMLDTLLRDRDAHALMIYPMKALAFDQRAQIQKLCKPLSIEISPYDGDTDVELRKELRGNPPQILLTNPEFLNRSFLANRHLWKDFLGNLKYIVIDEMHEYRGFFGGNMALSLRRFFLHLDSIGANPRVFLSTATCANPQEHAENLTGRDVQEVSAKDVLRPKRNFLFVNPDVPDYRRREIIQRRVEQAALFILAQGLQALVFCPTKRFIEETLKKCWATAEKNKIDPDRISAYHADMKSTEKRKIQRKIKNGSINVVFTTNALELGIDIGGLDGVILAGFPPNVMSAWQQIGRAGRGWDKEAFVLFYAMNDPIDQFFVGNLPAFLDKKLDALVVDPSNEGLIKKHLPSLTEETNAKLPASAKKILGPAFYDIAKKNPGRPPRRRARKPQFDLPIRGSFGQSYDLKFNDKKIGQISEMRLFREAYLGAIFTFFGKKYAVHAHEEDAVALTEAEEHLKTEPSFYTKLVSLDPFDGVSYDDIDIHYGTLDLSINFTGYRLIDEHTDEEIDSGSTGQSKYLNNLHAFWVYIPPGESANEGIGGLEHIIRVGAMFVIPADRFDTTTYSTAGEEPVASYYENYASGIGIAKKLYAVLPDVLRKGIGIADKCLCKSGCQNCIEPAKSYGISNPDIDKKRGIELARNLLDVVENEKHDHEWRNGGFVAV